MTILEIIIAVTAAYSVVVICAIVVVMDKTIKLNKDISDLRKSLKK
jgi:hypothetical protein